MRHHPGTVVLGIVFAAVSSAFIWGAILWVALSLVGCLPINLEASGSLNIGEHQEIRRRSETAVKAGASAELPWLTEKEPDDEKKALPPSAVLPEGE